MTDLPTPEDRLAALAAAITAADRAIAGLTAAGRLLDSIRPDAALALAMVSGDIASAVEALRRCRDVLAGGAA